MSTGQSPGGKFTGSTSEKSALKLLMPLALASEGQGTWDLTDFSERQIRSAKIRA